MNDDNRCARAGEILGRIFTPAWSEQEGEAASRSASVSDGSRRTGGRTTTNTPRGRNARFLSSRSRGSDMVGAAPHPFNPAHIWRLGDLRSVPMANRGHAIDDRVRFAAALPPSVGGATYGGRRT